MKQKLEILFDNAESGRVYKLPDGNYIALVYDWDDDVLVYTDDESVAKDSIGIYDDDDGDDDEE